MDKNLICNYTEQEKPKKGDNGVYDCCGGTHMVTDKRFNINYTCPKCTGKLDIV
jgi:predicted SprT family Zn-dependent metalloprotease